MICVDDSLLEYDIVYDTEVGKNEALIIIKSLNDELTPNPGENVY